VVVWCGKLTARKLACNLGRLCVEQAGGVSKMHEWLIGSVLSIPSKSKNRAPRRARCQVGLFCLSEGLEDAGKAAVPRWNGGLSK